MKTKSEKNVLYGSMDECPNAHETFFIMSI